MKAIKSILIVAIIVLVALVVIGFLLPKTSHVERSILIKSSPETIFPYLNSLKKFNQWSPWTDMDPNMIVAFSGPEEGVGSKSTWRSEKREVGAGSQEIIASVENEYVKTQLDLGDMGSPNASFTLDRQKGGIQVTWSLDQDHGNNIIGRYFGLILDDMLGPLYEQGLQTLKTKIEAMPYVIKEEIQYEIDGVPMTGYMAYPSDKQNAPGVLVVHEWWGHNPYARKRADMLAELGYVAFALDMYGEGKLAQHPKEAQGFMMEVVKNQELAQARFKKAMDILKAYPNSDDSKIAAIGYCFGGAVVLSMARSGADLDGVVSFHGSLGGLPPIAEDVKADILVLNGADDPFVTAEQKQTFKDEMQAADVAFEFVDYPNAVHSFTNPGATAVGEEFDLPLKYNEAADKASWQAMKAFLEKVFSEAE